MDRHYVLIVPDEKLAEMLYDENTTFHSLLVGMDRSIHDYASFRQQRFFAATEAKDFLEFLSKPFENEDFSEKMAKEMDNAYEKLCSAFRKKYNGLMIHLTYHDAYKDGDPNICQVNGGFWRLKCEHLLVKKTDWMKIFEQKSFITWRNHEV